MKKILVLTVSYLILLMLICFAILNMPESLTAKLVDTSESPQNLEKYKEDISVVAQKYGYTAVDLGYNELYYNGMYNKIIEINISKNEQINIELEGKIRPNNESCIEYVFIKYIKDNDLSDFNFGLFTDLVNAVSGKSLSIDTCRNLIEKNTSKASTAISERRNLDFNKYWYIDYSKDLLNEDKLSLYEESFAFSGLTKNGSRKSYIKEVLIWIALVISLSYAGIIITYRDIRKQKRLKKLYFKAPTI